MQTQRAVLALTLGAAALVQAASAPRAHAQAWPVTHKWSDKARPGDPTSGSFAYEYGAEADVIAGQMVAAGERFDCSKFALTVLTRYAMKNGLEVQFTLQEPVESWKWHTVSSSDPRFHSPDDWKTMYMSWINAKAIATRNTYKVSYDEWRAGDVVMMSWKQLGASDPFKDDQGNPRDVWHTYFVGEPGKLLFYGNDSGPNNDPLPIKATAEKFRIAEAMGQGFTGAAVYEGGPRRWNFLKDMVIPPEKPINAISPVLPEQATVTATLLNVREAPSATAAIVGTARKDEKLVIEGETPDHWLRVRRADGSIAYVSGRFATREPVPPSYEIVGGGEVDHRFDPDPPEAAPAPSTTTGVAGALGRGEP